MVPRNTNTNTNPHVNLVIRPPHPITPQTIRSSKPPQAHLPHPCPSEQIPNYRLFHKIFVLPNDASPQPRSGMALVDFSQEFAPTAQALARTRVCPYSRPDESPCHHPRRSSFYFVVTPSTTCGPPSHILPPRRPGPLHPMRSRPSTFSHSTG